VELDHPNFEFTPPADRRPTIPEPPPVKVIAVEDVYLGATTDESAKLDAFYVGLLKFERDKNEPGYVFKAENVRIRFTVTDPVKRDGMRVIGIEVPSLRDMELLLVDREIPFEKEPGLFVGQKTFLLQDPAGNWTRISETVGII